MASVTVTDIKYDAEVDGEIVDVSHLPSTMTFNVAADHNANEVLDYVSDWISDETGFCVLSFTFKE